MTDSTPWLPFESRPPLGDEQASSCYMSKVLYYERERGGCFRLYNGRAFRPADDAEGDFANLLAIRRTIEPQRRQGTSWFIHELPALVVAGERNAVVVCHVGVVKPLSGVSPLPAGLRDLDAVGRHFYVTDGNIRRFVCDRGLVPPAHLPFVRYSSFRKAWGWSRPSAERFYLGDLQGLVSETNEILQG